MRKDISTASFLLGFSSSVVQVLLMRVLVATLYGNEWVFVLALVAWLVGIAAGSAAGGLALGKTVDCRRMAFRLLFLSAALVPLAILAARSVRNLLGVPPGMLMDLLPAVGAVCLVVLPVSFLYGALFPALAAGARDMGIPDGARRVYAWEAAGFVAGGLAVTFFLLPSLDALSIASGVCALQLLAGALFSKRPVGIFLAVAVVAVLLAGGHVRTADRSSQEAQWKGFQVLSIRDTRYGNLLLLEKGGERSLFENGLHVATSGDALSSEENVHYALLAHPAPRRLLMVGGGLAGGLAEALKHPGLQVDYVELDPEAIRMAAENIGSFGETISDPRVHVVATDGRRFVQRSRRNYDVIILNLSDPFTLLVNRYYTVEFFYAVRRHLDPGGILALSVTAAENYLNREGREYLGTLRGTLARVFAEVRSIPGDRHIFLAAAAAGTVSVDPAVLAARLKGRGIKTKFVREAFFNFRLAPGRVEERERSLAQGMPLNRDTRPSAFLTALVFWSTHFHPGFSQAVRLFREYGWVLWILPGALWLVVLGGRRRRILAAGAVVAVAGFCLMIYQLAIWIALQSFYGYVYVFVGLMTAAFMAGAFAGAHWAGRGGSDAVEPRLRRVVLYAGGFAAAVGLVLPALAVWSGERAVLWGLAFLSLAAGYLGGAQFALALRYAGDGDRSPGLLYALDVLGASAGALLGGILLIPLWGVEATACFCAFLQAALLAGMLQPAR